MSPEGKSADNIYLIGPRASGKTSLGRALAGSLNREFADLDREIVAAQGRSISRIVEDLGWEGFRRLETEALEEKAARSGLVVATGGGIVEQDHNREILRRSKAVFFLSASPGVFADRLRRDRDPGMRPSLSGKGALEEFEEIFYRRLPLYEACADYVLDGGKDIPGLVREVRALIAARENEQTDPGSGGEI
ncbi:MAG: shikimate kinase [Desulfonatronovibrionaceae bacterium]